MRMYRIGQTIPNTKLGAFKELLISSEYQPQNLYKYLPENQLLKQAGPEIPAGISFDLFTLSLPI